MTRTIMTDTCVPGHPALVKRLEGGGKPVCDIHNSHVLNLKL